MTARKKTRCIAVVCHNRITATDARSSPAAPAGCWQPQYCYLVLAEQIRHQQPDTMADSRTHTAACRLGRLLVISPAPQVLQVVGKPCTAPVTLPRLRHSRQQLLPVTVGIAALLLLLPAAAAASSLIGSLRGIL
jgi:hypothetical protein